MICVLYLQVCLRLQLIVFGVIMFLAGVAEFISCSLSTREKRLRVAMEQPYRGGGPK